jgi:hypothetical protein
MAAGIDARLMSRVSHEGRKIRCLLESVDRGDVRMVERREDFGFPLKARQAVRVAGHRAGQHLDRHRPFQIVVGRPIHLAHAPRAKGRDNLVGPDPGAGCESHFFTSGFQF